MIFSGYPLFLSHFSVYVMYACVLNKIGVCRVPYTKTRYVTMCIGYAFGSLIIIKMGSTQAGCLLRFRLGTKQARLLSVASFVLIAFSQILSFCFIEYFPFFLNIYSNVSETSEADTNARSLDIIPLHQVSAVIYSTIQE